MVTAGTGVPTAGLVVGFGGVETWSVRVAVLGPQPASVNNVTIKKKLVRTFNTAPARPGTE
jgi:hypothetical protein